MTITQQTTADSLVAQYGEIVSVEPVEGRFDHHRVAVQYAGGASVIVNSNGTYIG